MAKVPSHPVQGDSDMTDRDITNRPSTTRRDLRFAGTVAAGLCAGVLGVGAIAVPLVGWNDWPQALSTSSGKPITLSTATRGGATGSGGASAKTRYTPRTTISGPTGAIALVTASGAPASGPAGSSGGTGISGTTVGTTTGRTVKRSRAGLTGAGGGSAASGKFRANGF